MQSSGSVEEVSLNCAVIGTRYNAATIKMHKRLLFAIPLTSILTGLSLLHGYWALGGNGGWITADPLFVVFGFAPLLQRNVKTMLR
jgi:hypothetical protein